MTDHLRDIARHLDEEAKRDPTRCPKCGQKGILNCPCPRRCGGCREGHRWHTCLACGVVVSRPADHGNHGCSCGAAKQWSPE